jgi:hypothetical protein
MTDRNAPNFRRRQSVTFTLSAHIIDGLDALSAETKRSRSSFADEALEDLLKKYRPVIGSGEKP